jgi:hypothetical protein
MALVVVFDPQSSATMRLTDNAVRARALSLSLSLSLYLYLHTNNVQRTNHTNLSMHLLSNSLFYHYSTVIGV